MEKVDNSAKRRIFSQSGPVIGLFAKQPIPGRVKTRLTPPLTAKQACCLYQTALTETLAQLQKTGFAITICYAGDQEWFASNFPALPLLVQRGETLGMRMTNAVGDLFVAAGGPVLLSGSDNPDIPPELVGQVVAQLQKSDVVTVPCRDGGYAVVGLRNPTTKIFVDIPWSTGQVLETTRQRCRELGLSYQETDYWDDLDDISDLKRLVERSPQSATAQHVVHELDELL